MLRSELTATAKRRLAHNCKCGICGEEIKEYQDMQMMIFPYGNRKVYRFFHTFCLIDSEGCIYPKAPFVQYKDKKGGSKKCQLENLKVRPRLAEASSEELQAIRESLESHSSHCANNFKF